MIDDPVPLTADERRARDRRDRAWMLLITVGVAVSIIVVLYFAGAFRRSTG